MTEVVTECTWHASSELHTAPARTSAVHGSAHMPRMTLSFHSPTTSDLRVLEEWHSFSGASCHNTRATLQDPMLLFPCIAVALRVYRLADEHRQLPRGQQLAGRVLQGYRPVVNDR